MNSLKRLVAVSLCLIVVAVGVGLLTTGSVRANKTDEVQVVNTADQAVPVSVVNASVPVTLGAATVPVSYSNTRSTPLFVDPGDSARNAVGAQCFIALYNGDTSCTLATVPAGKVLVIETLTCGATVVAGSPLTAMVMTMAAPDVSGSGFVNLNHFLGLTRIATIGSNDYYNVTSPVRMYASGGFPVTVRANAADGSHDASCAISGHLVDE